MTPPLCICGCPVNRNPFLCDACADKAWARVTVPVKIGRKDGR